MVHIDRVAHGINRYVDDEIVPHVTGLNKILVGMYVGLMDAHDLVNRYKDMPAIAALHIVDGDMVDIDRVHDVAEKVFDQKQEIMIPMLGKFTFDRSDVDKLYRYIQES